MRFREKNRHVHEVVKDKAMADRLQTWMTNVH
jgi:hypothetical protein